MFISKSMYDQFRIALKRGDYANQRLGQAFYNHFNLHKCNPKNVPAALYEADGDAALAIIYPMISSNY